MVERRRLDGLEPFDEWEELALKAAHYFLLTAAKGNIKSLLTHLQLNKVGTGASVTHLG